MKKGFTTGSCAQAAAKAAAVMLTTGKLVRRIRIETPSGKALNLNLIGQRIKKSSAYCAVIKDSGDDPDITDGVKICAEVRFSAQKGVTITAGRGVGKVTKPGLAVKVGEYAINPVPRQMINKEVSAFLPQGKGLKVIISVSEGKELARKTYNPRLGIIGGISIIGTSGIVVPKSLEAYKTSLSLQLDVLKAAGYKKAVLVLGYVGERFAKEVLKINDDSIIKIGDHVGFMLKECLKKGIKDILLIGHIGKLVKIAKGQFNTHSKFGDNRIDTIADYARACGAKKEVIKELAKQATAEATIDILRKNKLMKVFERIAQKISVSIKEFLGEKIHVKCVLLSLGGDILNASCPSSKSRVINREEGRGA